MVGAHASAPVWLPLIVRLLPTEPLVSAQFGESQMFPEMEPPRIAYGYALRLMLALMKNVAPPLFSWKQAVPLVACGSMPDIWRDPISSPLGVKFCCTVASCDVACTAPFDA